MRHVMLPCRVTDLHAAICTAPVAAHCLTAQLGCQPSSLPVCSWTFRQTEQELNGNPSHAQMHSGPGSGLQFTLGISCLNSHHSTQVNKLCAAAGHPGRV